MNVSNVITQVAAVSLSNVLVTGSVLTVSGVKRVVWYDDALGLCSAEIQYQSRTSTKFGHVNKGDEP